MSSMDPTTADTIDADDANKIAAEDQDMTGGAETMPGETTAAEGDSLADTLGSGPTPGDGEIAGETERPGD